MPKNEDGSYGAKLAALWREVLSIPPSSNTAELWKEHLRIRQALETSNKRKQIDWTDEERMQRLPAFLSWCDKMGIRHSNLEVRPSQNGLSLCATNATKKEDIAANVPVDACLSLDAAEANETLKNILMGDEILRAMDNVALAITVAHEVLSASESKWASYLDILPSHFSTTIFYSEQHLQLLKPSPIFEESLGMYRAVARQFVYFYLRILGDTGEKAKKRMIGSASANLFAASPFTTHNFTFDLYRWCVAVVSTRINMIPSKIRLNSDGTPKMIPALIPLIDFANHACISTGPASVFFEPESNAVKLQLNKALGGGEEIYIHYGARSNGKFLLHNGFVPNVPNPDDFYELKIGLPRSSHDYRAKLQYLAQKSIFSSAAETNQQQSSIFSFQLKPNPNPDAIADLPLFHFARAFIANSEIEGTFGSLENDNKAKKFLMDRIRLLLHCYAKNGSLNADPTDVAICRLKESEIAMLNAYLKCLEP